MRNYVGEALEIHYFFARTLTPEYSAARGYPPRFGDEDQVKLRPQPDEFQKPEDIQVPPRAAAAPPARQLQD